MADEMVIEKVGDAELQEAFSLLDKYVPQIYASSYDAWREKVARQCETGEKTLIGAMLAGKLVGIAIYQEMRKDFTGSSTIEIKTLLVEEAYRQRRERIGSSLLEQVHYDIQRLGYGHAMIEAKSDQSIVPWLINKGYSVVGTHMDCGWPSYRMEVELTPLFTDDIHDEGLVLQWIAARLGITNLKKVDGRTSATYDGQIPLSGSGIQIALGSRISFCTDEAILNSYLKADENQAKVLFYAVNRERNGIPPDLCRMAKSANAAVLARDDLRVILGVDLPKRGDVPPMGHCLAVLVYPEVFERLIDQFSGREFSYVVSGYLGRLLSRDSRLIFVSNDDFRILGAASYLSRMRLESRQEVWRQCSDMIAFDERAFRRWSALKRHFTVFRCAGLKRAPADCPSRIDTVRVRQNKWDYYSYDAFMKYVVPVLS